MQKRTSYIRVGKGKRLHINVRTVADIKEVAHVLRDAALKLRATAMHDDRYTMMRAEIILAEAGTALRVMDLRNRFAVPVGEAKARNDRLVDARRFSNNIKGVVS